MRTDSFYGISDLSSALSALLRAMLEQIFRDIANGLEGEELAASRLRFILRISRSAPDLSDLYANAQTVLATVDLSRLGSSPTSSNVAGSQFQIPVYVWKDYQRAFADTLSSIAKLEEQEQSVSDHTDIALQILQAIATSIKAVAKTVPGIVNQKIVEEAAILAIDAATSQRKLWTVSLS